MKTEIIVEASQIKPYPKMMIDKSTLGTDNLAVLFSEDCKGTVVGFSKESYLNYEIGYHSSCWNMDRFIDFEGTVLITQ